ncbi:MAG: alanine racemase [Candidatus Eisenbacteria bacterium]|uniref:Alanine racemase n=1 Tax=Eiseniibacteriota bacterium TaxID=2212470 RepID=A0A937X9H0_UNCEI|nr:alanine racemase [Candidatus Eisenbacteria bacterium]
MISDGAVHCRLLEERELLRFVEPHFRRRAVYLAAAAAHGSPLYLIDAQTLRARARRCLEAWIGAWPGAGVFYAVKSNAHPEVCRLLVAEGLGLDVSSGRELELALAAGAERIIFSGPGKTPDELRLALHHAARVTVLLDSFGELRRLTSIAAEAGASPRAGVRLTTEETGLWRKFGIPLAALPDFLAAAGRGGRVTIAGLQFHTSWNLSPDRQLAFIERLGRALADLPAGAGERLEFLDVGGGFWPERGEWLHAPPPGSIPTDPATRGEAAGERGADGSAPTVPDASAPRAAGAAAAPAGARPKPPPPQPRPHFVCPAQPLELFAGALAGAVRRWISPHAPVAMHCEPGRWLSDEAMHLLLTVIDLKRPDLAVTDGATNAVGWERFETDYCPVLNLSRPAPTERAADIHGSLCTPHDVWGSAYFGEGIEEGDRLLIPAQGAYTYSLRQEFIKPLPRTVLI